MILAPGHRTRAADIWYQEPHHSTAIEGNTLVFKVEALLAEGRAVGDKQLKEYMDVRKYACWFELIHPFLDGNGRTVD
jgi:fido (protein-threonine AMPylation protein)